MQPAFSGPMRRPMSLPPRPSFGRPAAAGAPAEAPAEVSVEVEAATEPEENDEEAARLGAGYVSPAQRCSTCSHCDETSRCALYSFACEPDGGCPDHEAGESEPATAETAATE